MQISCEQCWKKFELSEDRFKKKTVAKGITQIYLECPNCKTEYHSYYENDKVIKLMEANAELQIVSRNTSRTYGTMLAIKANKEKIEKEQEKIIRILENN